VSEEDCGVVTGRIRGRLAEIAEGDPTKFVLVDSRERIGLFRNVCIKPNEDEFSKGFDVNTRPLPWSPTILLDIAYLARRPMFFTGGAKGIEIISPPRSADDPGSHVESAKALVDCYASAAAYPVVGPIDICGAGDSCSAGIACAMVGGLTHEQAAAFGNLVASITIQQIGVTGTATPAQVRTRWREVSGSA
jgi:sugar/nucleoside kinase (ribokinase family)